MKKTRLFVIPFLYLFLFFTVNSQPVFSNIPTGFLNTAAERFLRTDLYFGRDKNDGTDVTDEEWNEFLDEFVTPKFPGGMTVLDASGQYRLENGKIVKERSKVLILLYPINTRTVNSRKIEQIRNEYKKRFKQESVLRIDLRQTVRVSF